MPSASSGRRGRAAGRLLIAFGVLAALCTDLLGEVWLVEGWRTDAGGDLQLAIEQAASGDVIVVRGGEYRGIRIDKTLHLAGEQGARITWPLDSESRLAPAAIEISGTQGDIVCLSGFEVGGADATAGAMAASPGVRARGIDLLVIKGCRIAGQGRVGGLDDGPHGDGAPAVEVWTGEVWVADSLLHGGRGGSHQGRPGFAASGCGGAGLFAPNSQGLVLRSGLTGGGGGDLWMVGGLMQVERVTRLGGRGGSGACALALVSVASGLRGGSGGRVLEGARATWALPDGVPLEGRSLRFPMHLETSRAEGMSTGPEVRLHREPGEPVWFLVGRGLRAGLAELSCGLERGVVLDPILSNLLDPARCDQAHPAPGIEELSFDPARMSWRLPPSTPLLLQAVRWTRTGQLVWSNPEILLMPQDL